MNEFGLIYPMFAMVLLTFGVLLTMLRTRLKLMAADRLEIGYFQVYRGDEPEASLRLSRHFTNLLESPTLFYAACLAGMVSHQSTATLQALAWAYVLARCVHSYIHLGKNEVQNRVTAYFLSWALIVGMWGYLAVGVIG